MAQGARRPGALPGPIRTLMRLHRRWHAQPDGHDVLVAASGGQLYWRLPGEDAWQRIALPEGFAGEGYRCDEWSCVAYEMSPEGADAPVDVLLLSNAQDGMLCLRGDSMTVSIVETPKKFGVIARHAERIWGGAIADDPDMLAYSAPFDPFDWAQNDEFPEDGAGDVLQPSWDGDSFTALTPFGSQLLALKRTRVWRVMGTNPGEYVFKEQYGGGTPYAATVAVDNTAVWMLGRDGLCRYDGETVSPHQPTRAAGVFARMHAQALAGACACMYRGVYLCALPLDGAANNNAVLLYDTREDTWLLREGVSVESFLPTEDALYFTSAHTPGQVWQWRDDCWPSLPAEGVRWVSPWCDLGQKNARKEGFALYLAVECREPVTLCITLETERRQKTRAVRFAPTPPGSRAPQRRIRFGGSGRQFRLTLSSPPGAAWRVTGGMQVECEVDVD